MPIAAGSLNRRILIERATEVEDEFNTSEPIWGPLCPPVWASKEDVRDSERFAGQQVGADITTRFQIRYSSQVADVNPKDRIRFDGRVYSIIAVKEIGRREGLELSATARADLTAN